MPNMDNCCMAPFSSVPGPKNVEDFKEKLDELKDGDSSVYWLLQQSAPKVKKDRECVLAAVKKNGLSLDVASRELKADQQIVLEAVGQDGDAFSYVDKFNTMWSDRAFVLRMVKMQGSALQYATPGLTADEEVVMAAIENKGSSLAYADVKFKNNSAACLAAVQKEGYDKFGNPVGDAFKHVSKTGVMWKDPNFVIPMVRMLRGNALHYVDKDAPMWKDQTFVLNMVELQGNALKFADPSLKENPKVVVAAVRERGDALDFVNKNAKLWENKEVVLDLVQATGRALEHVSAQLKSTREVVEAAVRTTPTSLRFAGGTLQQDARLMRELMAIEQDDSEHQHYAQSPQAILSLGFNRKDYATNFAAMLKRNEYLRNFKTHNPHAWRENCCGPDPMDIQNACRGTASTCKFVETQNLFEERPGGDMKPAKQSCWRFSFRFHLEQIKGANGFMIQVADKNNLDNGQKIETEMAQQAEVKIFRTMTTSEDVSEDQLKVLEDAIKDWFSKGSKNKYMVELQLRV